MKNLFAKSGIGFALAGLMLVTALFSSGCAYRRYGYGPGYYGPRHHEYHDRDHDRDGYHYR